MHIRQVLDDKAIDESIADVSISDDVNRCE